MTTSAFRTVLAALALVGSVSSPAFAQRMPLRVGFRPTLKAKVTVEFNGVYTMSSPDFGDSATFTENVEPGLFGVNYNGKGGAAFDVGASYRFGKTLAIGGGLTQFSQKATAAFSASVPHPFFFNEPRSIDATLTDLKRSERAINIRLMFLKPVGRNIVVTAFGGPSFFSSTRDLINDFSYTDSYPYDSAELADTAKDQVTKSGVGFNAGADVTYYLGKTQQVGVGGWVRFARGSVEFPGISGGSIKATLGGMQSGGGIRVRF